MAKTQIQLSDHFTYKKLVRFTLPSVAMMVFTSIYGVVDGFFVSNFAGKTPFAAVNLIMPFLLILASVGFMFGTGGSALVSKTLGEGHTQKAKEQFSLIIITSFICGVVLAVLGIIFLRPVALLLGADETMIEECVTYGTIILAVLPAYILQYEFQSFFVTAEKPKLGLAVTIVAGLMNMIFDALLVAIIPLGVAGAAIATATCQIVGGIFPLIYFLRKNSSILRIIKPKMDKRALLKACGNGSSELLSNIAISLISMLYNVQLMKYAGENGIAAYGVLMYVGMIFYNVFFGYSIGVAPVIGYNYGSGNHEELKNMRRKSLIIIIGLSVVMTILAEVLAAPLSNIYVGYDAELYALTLQGFTIFSFSFLFAGMAIFGSSFFTALNNGLVSALISALRTLVFQIAAVLIFPLIWEIDGIWLSLVAAEFMAVVVVVIFMIALRKKYNY